MGSKTPEHDHHRRHGESSELDTSNDVGGEPRGSHKSRDGDGCLGEAGDGGDDDEDHDGASSGAGLTARSPNATNQTLDPKKKRKKPKKKKAASQASKKQSSPPRVLISELFPAGDYPHGEVQQYPVARDRTARTTVAELRYEARRRAQGEDFLKNYRQAAEVHRQARQWVQQSVKPGHKVSDIIDGIEDSVRALLGNQGLETGDCIRSGMGFPTGVCLSNQVAHYTTNPGQKDVVVQQHDTMTVDFGVHINGWIIDSAFTVAWDPTYDNLLAAVKDATNTGIKAAGIDVRISDISAAIQETMESYEVEIRGKTYRVKPVQNLSAHNIEHYRIHGGKSIPFVKNSDQTKMEEGEVYAIETFGTTGRGYVHDDVGIYGYSLNHDGPLTSSLPLASAKRLHKTIRENFSTIPFCRRYLERLGVDRYLAGMNCLVSHGIVEAYKPLADIEGSYSAQFEHTFVLRDTQKEVLSRGEDY